MTKWAFIENNEIKGVYDNLPRSWRNISGFNLINDLELLKTHGWRKVDRYISFDTEKFNEMGYTYSLIDNSIVANPILVEKKPDVNQYDLETIRIQRDELLNKTDIYQLSDWQSSFDDDLKYEWLMYRQKLRNITNEIYEFNIEILNSEFENLVRKSKIVFNQYILNNISGTA